ncbi:MAG: hypothetical protein A2Z18_07565 [Armatimonadetes bacterium RBG_16_58_9]|nr:MAG: hypothetical protein A2Z18_07565 [Armatimonadetes bacterium RBG_16_58_9]
MPHSKWRSLLVVVKRALVAPLSLGLLAYGVLWAVLLHSSPLGILGLCGAVAAVAIYVTVKLRDEQFVRDALRDALEREQRARAFRRSFHIEELEVESRIKVKAIVKLQSEIADDVVNSPIDEVAVGLADTVAQTEHLVERALEMARKRRELQHYLNRTDDKAIEHRVEALREKLPGETDSERRSEIEMSLGAKQRELDDYRAIERSSQRILEQLDSIECSFAGLRARLVRIKSTDITEWIAANEELRTELGGLNTSVDTLEQSINEALTSDE